jgi:hypothetical protein
MISCLSLNPRCPLIPGFKVSPFSWSAVSFYVQTIQHVIKPLDLLHYEYFSQFPLISNENNTLRDWLENTVERFNCHILEQVVVGA